MASCRLSCRVLICSLLVVVAQVCYSQGSPQGTSATGSQTPPASQPASQGASAPADSSSPASPASTSTSTPEAGLSVSKKALSFDEVVSTTSAAQTLILTNGSKVPLSVATSIAASPGSTPSDFKAESNCQDLPANASCSVTVTFTPTHPVETTGSLNIVVTPQNGTKTYQSVPLTGKGRLTCSLIGFSWNWAMALLFGVVGLYFIGLVLIRWHMIAKPMRAKLVAQIRSIWSWVEAETSNWSPPPPQARIEQIKELLDMAALPFNSRKIRVTISENLGCLPPATRRFNAIFWTRGAELAGWNYAHQAEQQLVALLPEPRVCAAMETAEAELRQFKTDPADAMANRLHAALQPGAPAALASLQALLIEAQSLIYSHRDSGFGLLADWHNKMIWLVGCALLFIVAIGLTFQNSALMLVGAVGGLLSRLMQSLKAENGGNDYGTSWGSLFLSPLTGALAAWGGILLMILAVKLQILGAALSFDWCNPYQPVTLAVALLLGFTERLFDDLVTQIEPKLLPSSTPKGAPTISSIDPPTAKIGQQVTLTVHGANFQSGVSATVTDQNKNPATATAAYRDASTITVTFTPAVTSPPSSPPGYRSTLTITNPDKQSAKFDFDVNP